MYEDITAFPFNEADRPFKIQMCGISYCDGAYKISRPDSKVWCIEYIIKGKGSVNVDNVSFTASEGDIYILPEGCNHLYYSDSETPWEKIWFNISGSLTGGLMEIYGLKNIYHIERLNLYLEFKEFLDTAKTAPSAETAEKLCTVVFMKIVQAMSERVKPQGVYRPLTPALRLKEKIDNLTDFTVSFDELIKDLYCTKSHIIRQFKAEYKVTPYSFLLNKKIIAAKTMIEGTAMNMTEISDYLGFKDCHYFSNFFRKRVGVSPSEYKKRIMGRNAR